MKEGVVRNFGFLISTIVLMGATLLTSGCATKEIDYKASEKLQNNEEFKKLVKIKEIPLTEDERKKLEASRVSADETDEKSVKEAVEKSPETSKSEEKVEAKKLKSAQASASKKVAKAQKKSVKNKSKKAESKTMKRQPDIEDSENFDGRRPLVEPFRIGESIVLDLSYFNITAGTMELAVGPYVELNGRKAYTFLVKLKSNSMFSRFYAVDDTASTHVDYETLLPYDHQISVKESKQVREIKSYFDFEKNEANFWETKVTKDKGKESKKLKWDILPFSQNVVSSIFYLRNFTLEPGKKIIFRVAEEGKNIICTVNVLRREKLKTDLGFFDTVVIQPQIEVNGVFKPVGDVFFWLTDDDRKLVVRFESEIKIGTVVGKLKSIRR